MIRKYWWVGIFLILSIPVIYRFLNPGTNNIQNSDMDLSPVTVQGSNGNQAVTFPASFASGGSVLKLPPPMMENLIGNRGGKLVSTTTPVGQLAGKWIA